MAAFPLHSGMSRAEHPQFLKVDVDCWYILGFPFLFIFLFFVFCCCVFCSKLIENTKMMVCVVRLSLLEAIQRREWVTVSTSIVKLEVEIVQAALCSWMVVEPCLTMKPHPDWSLVTEPSVYTMRSCELLFSWTKSLISESVLPAGRSRQCLYMFLAGVSQREAEVCITSWTNKGCAPMSRSKKVLLLHTIISTEEKGKRRRPIPAGF